VESSLARSLKEFSGPHLLVEKKIYYFCEFLCNAAAHCSIPGPSRPHPLMGVVSRSAEGRPGNRNRLIFAEESNSDAGPVSERQKVLRRRPKLRPLTALRPAISICDLDQFWTFALAQWVPSLPKIATGAFEHLSRKKKKMNQVPIGWSFSYDREHFAPADSSGCLPQ